MACVESGLYMLDTLFYQNNSVARFVCLSVHVFMFKTILNNSSGDSFGFKIFLLICFRLLDVFLCFLMILYHAMHSAA